MRKILTVLFLGISTLSYAGDAGCGLGGMVMQKQSKVSQTLAVTTNGTFLNQLFGITSGTSGCASSSIVQNKVEAIKYAEANFENLKVDIARGEGESLTSVGTLLGCQGAALKDFTQMSQKNFSDIVPTDAKPAQVIDALDQKIQSDKTLSSQCLSNA